MSKSNRPHSYVVFTNKSQCIVPSWDECKELTSGISGAIFKKFSKKEIAEKYLMLLKSGVSAGQAAKQVEALLPNSANTNMGSKGLPPHHDKAVAIYSDGSFIADAGGAFTKTAGWGFVVLHLGKMVHEDYGVISGEEVVESRNVAAEIEATVRSVKWAEANLSKPIAQANGMHVFHDYLGIAHWVTGKWKTKKQLTKNYFESLLPYKNMLHFHHVLAHSGIAFNERVDRKTRSHLIAHCKKIGRS